MIELKNVFAGYGKENILKGVSVDFPKGKLLSIIGPNGSGKSTMLKTAMGILHPSEGDVLIDKKRIEDMSRQDIAKKTAYLAQGKNVPDMTVEQMVLHGRFPHLRYPRRYSENDRKIALSAIEKLGLSSVSEKKLTSLSGGMRQNTYIAMALAQDTDYIFLDEPTTYLDISNQISIMKIIAGLAKSGKGIVTVMHDLPLAFSFSDIIVVLENGRIVDCDNPKNLYKKNVIKRVFDTELKFSEQENYFYYLYR